MIGYIEDKSDGRKDDSKPFVGAAIVIIVFGSAIVANLDFFTVANLRVQKDFISAVGTMISSSLLMLGAIFSYYRFFKGRTFTEKLNIRINLKVIECDDKENIHALDIALSNTSSIVIRDPEAMLTVSLIDRDALKLDPIQLQVPDFDPSKSNALIEPQENFHYHKNLIVAKSVKAVSYYVSVRSKRNHRWGKIITVPNRLPYEYLETK